MPLLPRIFTNWLGPLCEGTGLDDLMFPMDAEGLKAKARAEAPAEARECGFGEERDGMDKNLDNILNAFRTEANLSYAGCDVVCADVLFLLFCAVVRVLFCVLCVCGAFACLR